MSTIAPSGAPECESVDRGVEHGAILLFTCAQRLLDLYAFGDILLQAGLGMGDLVCHGIERTAQSSELVASPESAAGGEIPGRELFGRSHQLVGAASQQEVENDPQGCRECRHPPRPVE